MESRPTRIIFVVMAGLAICLGVLALVTGSTQKLNPVSPPSNLAYNPGQTFTGGSYSGGLTLGSNMVHTLTDEIAFPVTSKAAESKGYSAVDDFCKPGLGFLYEPTGGPSHSQPLSPYYTGAGQLAGLKITIWGSTGDFGSSPFEGPAALGNMVSQGYYTPVAGQKNTWEMSVSFRSPSDICSSDVSKAEIGDRIIINQHTIAKSVPMTAGEADSAGWQPGSCMSKMGQHHFYDLSEGSTMSFITGNLLPITPMYYPVNDPNAKINAIFFSTPACQDDTVATAWDNVPLYCSLTSGLMCANFCNAECDVSLTATSPWHSPTTNRYGTLHVFFNSHAGLDSVTCPEPRSSGFISAAAGRSCPANTQTPSHSCSWYNILCRSL